MEGFMEKHFIPMKGSSNPQSSSFMTIINTEGHEGKDNLWGVCVELFTMMTKKGKNVLMREESESLVWE